MRNEDQSAVDTIRSSMETRIRLLEEELALLVKAVS